jgi:hypothetical protein
MRTLAALALAASLAAAAELNFNRDIRPILSDRCFACHGPDPGNRKSNLRLDVEAEAKADLGGGRRGVVEGQPEASGVIQRVTSRNKSLRMPPAYAGHDALAERDIETLREWIRQGAKYAPHYAFAAPSRPDPPRVRNEAWARNPVDRFILARLEREGLSPSPEADRERLLRRVSLDLTGLAPSPEETARFLADSTDQAYERAVDRLLASPRYAERMAVRWLEAARYADTNGYQSDGPRDMWRWRDWVIAAFHRNMPFDRFTIEQIAGDLLPGAALDQRIATAFHRNHRTSAEGGIVDEEFRVEYVADRTETTATVWLGLTLGCARCHDHKYDPFTQKDFYSLFAFFNQVPEKGFVYNFGNEEPYIKAPLPEQAEHLRVLDGELAAARAKYEAALAAAAGARRAWEKSLRKSPPLRWAPAEGLALHVPEAGAFDGKRELVAAPPESVRLNYRDPFTFAAWIKPESEKGAILSKAEEYFEGTGHGLYLVDGKLRLHVVFRWTDLGMRLETEEPLKLREWQHVAVTYDGGMKASGVSMYVNGRKQKVKILFDQCIWPLDPKEPWRIGSGGGLKFEGAIGEVRVWTRELPAEEVGTLPLRATLNELAARKMPGAAERRLLELAFLDLAAPAPLREAREELRLRRIARDDFYAKIPTVMVMTDRPEKRPTFVLKRGAYDAPGEPVEAGTPAALPPMRPEWPRNRLGLAYWLVSRENPLTARVAVNRFWQMLFGTGLVKTTEDLGSQGEWPVHLELLDWLAVEFMDSGWDVKRILKTIVMSNTYRQSSRLTPELLQRDPENRLYARGPRLRLGPEAIRDQALQASGLLVERVGGPSVKPYQPPGLWKELSGGEYETGAGEDLYRRSLYTYWRRTIAPPAMITFDSPTREVCTVRETRTNTPLQALNLMNDVTYVEAARKLAERMMDHGDPLEHGFRLVLARSPRAEEKAVLKKMLERFRSRYAAEPAEAGKLLAVGASPLARPVSPEFAAYAAVASMLLNLDEAVTKE